MYKISIIGAGFMGGIHAQNIAKLEQAELTAVCDTNPEAARALSGRFDAKAYTDYDTMLDNEKPDAVVIALPPFAHKGEAEKAAEQGIHIFMEKPVGISAERAKEMVQTVTASGVKTQVGYHCRFGGAVMELQKLIAEGKAGRPVLFSGRYECNSLHGKWWRDKDKCGSQMLEQAIHTYDMSMLLMGKPVSVSGLADNLCHRSIEGYTIEDVSASLIRFDSGAIGSITATNCAVPGRWNNPFFVVFENLSAAFMNPNHAVFTDTSNGKAAESEIKCDNDLYLDEIAAFLELLEGKRQSACTIAEGYESLCLVDIAMQSAALGGTPVTL